MRKNNLISVMGKSLMATFIIVSFVIGSVPVTGFAATPKAGEEKPPAVAARSDTAFTNAANLVADKNAQLALASVTQSQPAVLSSPVSQPLTTSTPVPAVKLVKPVVTPVNPPVTPVNPGVTPVLISPNTYSLPAFGATVKMLPNGTLAELCVVDPKTGIKYQLTCDALGKPKSYTATAPNGIFKDLRWESNWGPTGGVIEIIGIGDFGMDITVDTRVPLFSLGIIDWRPDHLMSYHLTWDGDHWVVTSGPLNIP